MKKTIYTITVFFAISIIIGCASSSTFYKLVRYNFADIKDYKIFEARPLVASNKPYNYAYAQMPIEIDKLIPEANVDFKKYIINNKSVAFLIIKNDSIQYEQYVNGYDTLNIVPSFSMAKSITSILIGCALQDGLIKNLQEPITNYIPEMKPNGFKEVTIEHVMQMTSGIAFNESYWNPMGEAAKFYYGDQLSNNTSKLKLANPPGTRFNYVSGNTQILGLILQRALGPKPITEYLQEKLWTPLGMEYSASWSLDNKNGIEKTFCCLNARAKDFAKIGSMFLHNGFFNGQQIVTADWVKQSTIPDITKGGESFYKYQWWLLGNDGDYMAQGILGQYIYVNPKKNLVIVRLGKTENKIEWSEIFSKIAQAY